MARTGQQDRMRNRRWMTAFWFTGVVLFMMELNAGLNYVESRFADLSPKFLDAVPAWGLATFKLVEDAFWNFAELEATFRITPLVALPFALLGLAISMRGFMGFRRR